MRLSCLDSSDYYVVDIETNWTDLYAERYVMGIAITIEDDDYYIPVRHNRYYGPVINLDPPRNIFSNSVAKLVFHNAKFDIMYLQDDGYDIPMNFDDTMLMAHYINENFKNYSLDALCRTYKVQGKFAAAKAAVKGLDWNNTPPAIMLHYAARDGSATRNLYERLKHKFELYREIWESVDRDFLMLLLKMERKGIRVDTERCAELEKACEDRIAQIQEELGFDPSKPSLLRSKLFDEPPYGFGLKPLSYTPKKREPQVNTKFLESTNHPVCGLILEYRELTKQLTSYFRPYQKLGSYGGRIHPSFRMHGTRTGRLSCANPNLQQVPRDAKVKEVFLPEEDNDLVEIDYSNLEMRLMTVYAEQKDLHEEFSSREGDVHGRVAKMLGVERFKAKTVNFLITYGGGQKVLSDQLGISLTEASQILTAYKKQYPEIFTVAGIAAKTCEKTNGEVKMWSGRKRHFEYPSEFHKAFNSVIQGGAFEIVKRSMLKLDKAGFDIRNQVHDSVWINESDPERIKEAERIMEDWVLEDFGLPFFVESKVLTSRK